MKRILVIAAALAAAFSCQKVVINDYADGAITVALSNSPIVELVTKAGEAVPTDNFNVYVQSSAEGASVQWYKYGEFPSPFSVAVGEYSLWADSITQEESVTGWGDVRYATSAPVTKIVTTGNATKFELNCAMVNTAVSVVFDGDFDTYLFDYKVSVSVQDDEDRVLVFDADNTSGDTPAVGYFIPSAKLQYTFEAKDNSNTALNPKSGSMDITAATHLQLKFKIKAGLTGGLAPEITVDPTCTELTQEVEVDPTDIPSVE